MFTFFDINLESLKNAFKIVCQSKEEFEPEDNS